MPELLERLRPGLADRYRLEREVGRGGMATVLLARDLRYDRPVALKVLAAELARSVGPERFQREIMLAAGLQHPHILPVLDSGETAGHLWFTMPYVDGESLRDLLRRERQLPIDGAVRIAIDAARALAHAHERGVIHRDVKPENLLLTRDGSTLVADFGIARALGSGDEPGLTETGISVGTPAYMSPEQAAGERDLDARTDVYALGTVLYEMLAGEPPYTGPTAAALAAKRLMGEVPRVRLTRPSVPEHLERALLRALAPLPADRFGTMAEFARSLSDPGAPATARVATTPALSEAGRGRRRSWSLIAAVTIVLLAGLGILLGRRFTPDRATGSDPRRLAVLPFENLGPADEAYFADGLTDAIRGKLAALPGLQVTARSSSNQYRGAGKTPQQIGRELDV
ncbi:MAG: protein kinase, partial [Gemmatimonadales bacterium]|nr:protein kinase [Gemmatimonadales bacterium]